MISILYFFKHKNEPYDVTFGLLGNKSHNIRRKLLYVCFHEIYINYIIIQNPSFIYLFAFVFRNVLGHFSSMYTADTSWSSTV